MSGMCEAWTASLGLAEASAIPTAIVVSAESALAAIAISAVSTVPSGAVGAGAARRRSGVRADVDRLAGDDDVLHLVDVTLAPQLG